MSNTQDMKMGIKFYHCNATFVTMDSNLFFLFKYCLSFFKD